MSGLDRLFYIKLCYVRLGVVRYGCFSFGQEMEGYDKCWNVKFVYWNFQYGNCEFFILGFWTFENYDGFQMSDKSISWGRAEPDLIVVWTVVKSVETHLNSKCRLRNAVLKETFVSTMSAVSVWRERSKLRTLKSKSRCKFAVTCSVLSGY
jgi:hypothetical protein